MIQLIHGDLLEAKADVICQQVNCRNAMGSGLAKAIYTRWPAVKELYHRFCDDVGDPYALLGMVQIIPACRTIPFDIANVFGQLNYGWRSVCYTSYDALRTAFRELNSLYGKDRIIAFPYGFGCGLAGGDWNTVYALIESSFPDRTVQIYKNDV